MRNRLRVLRAEHGWTQEELGRRLGVSRQAVNAVETGKYDPSLPLAIRIARLFGEPVEQIFTLDEPPGEDGALQLGHGPAEASPSPTFGPRGSGRSRAGMA